MKRLEWFALVWLASAVLTGCASKTNETAEPAQPDEPAVAATEAPDGEAAAAAAAAEPMTANADLAAAERAVSLDRSKRDYLVAQFMKFGDEARREGDWVEAQRSYIKVLEIDPGNADAQKRLDEAAAFLGERPGSVRTAIDAEESRMNVQRQQAQSEITDLVKRAGMHEGDSDYDGAIRKYEKALLIAGLFPYSGDFNPSDSQLKDMIASATARKVESNKARRDAELREARSIKDAEEAKLRASKEARLRALFRDANIAMERNQFDLAYNYAEQILRLDPVNEGAAKLAKIAREAKMASEEAMTRRNIKEQWRRTFEKVEEAATPQITPVLFPDEWLKVQHLRKPYNVSTRAGAFADDPRAKQIENVLNTTTVNINFEDTRLQDSVNFLAQYANVNIIVLPSVFEEFSEDELLVTLRADNVSVANALELITLTKGLSYRIDKGVVQIGTTAEGRGEMVLDLYDVKDLTVPIVSFPGEDMNLVPSGGFGFGFDEAEELEPMKPFEGDALADLIRDTIDIEVWDEGGDVQFREGGILIVKAPVSTHSKVRELLDGLRASGGVTVTLETRFITVEDNFLQDIGVDLRGLGDQTGGVGVPGKGTQTTFDDVLFGTPANPIGVGTSNFAGVFYNLNSDGDVRGRVENLLDVALGRTGVLQSTGGTSIQATFLDDTQVNVILRAVQKSSRATLVVAPKLMAYDHERANVTVMNQVSYIQDFDVEIAQAAQIGDPIVQTLRDGVILDITPIVSSDRKYVTLELRPTVAQLQRPIQTFTTTLANGPPVTIQLPELRIERVRTTVTMPDGGILLIGGLKFYEEVRAESSVPWLNKIPILSFFWSRKGTYISRRNLIILIKVKILVLEEMAPTITGR